MFVSKRIDALVAQRVLKFYLTRKRAATKLGHGQGTHKFLTWFLKVLGWIPLGFGFGSPWTWFGPGSVLVLALLGSWFDFIRLLF